jgi:cell division protein FtsB
VRPLWLALAIAAAACGYLMLGSEGDASTWLRLRAEVRLAEARVRALAAENRRLADEVEALRADPFALERAVREELGWVRPGEVVVRVPGSGALP